MRVRRDTTKVNGLFRIMSILAIAYGVVSVDFNLTRKHIIGFIFQIAASVLTAMIYFMMSPVKTPTTEILARISPSFFDVIIASAGGIAGIVVQRFLH